MISTKTEIKLSPEARGILSDLFRSAEGQTIIEALAALCPAILSEGTPENMLASAHMHKGWEKCVEQMVDFGQPDEKAPEQKSSEYPPLDDDGAWEKQQSEKQT